MQIDFCTWEFVSPGHIVGDIGVQSSEYGAGAPFQTGGGHSPPDTPVLQSSYHVTEYIRFLGETDRQESDYFGDIGVEGRFSVVRERVRDRLTE